MTKWHAATGYNAVLDQEAMVMMPELPMDAPDQLARAWEMRLQANVTGLCPNCGASVGMPNRHERRRAQKLGETIMHGTMAHSDECPVSDAGLRELLARGDDPDDWIAIA